MRSINLSVEKLLATAHSGTNIPECCSALETMGICALQALRYSTSRILGSLLTALVRTIRNFAGPRGQRIAVFIGNVYQRQNLTTSSSM